MQNVARLVGSTCRACGLDFAYEHTGPGRKRRFCEPCAKSLKPAQRYDQRVYQGRYGLKRRAAGLHWSEGRKRRTATCGHCGAGFETAQRIAKVCSRACLSAIQDARRKSDEQKAATKQDRWQRRRARKANAPRVERVDLIAVFERDNWICWICGEPAPRSLRGKRHPMAPTGDHVIPLARGGDHTAVNVRCAHATCNFSKCDKLPSEMGLSVQGFSGEIRF